MHAFLRPGDIFVDVGANIGLFSLIAAQIVGASGIVHAFEPCETTFRRLEDNVVMNRHAHIYCHRAALSDRAGTMALSVSTDGMDAWNALAEQPYMGASYCRETVQTLTWDEFAQEHNLVGRVSLMKIDVEGWETNVLKGATRTLSRDDAPVLQVEFTDAAADASGASCQELYESIERLGYRLFRYDERTRALVPEPMRDAFGYVNLFAVKHLASVHSRLSICS